MIYKIVGDFTWADNTSSPLGRPGEVSSYGVIGGGQGNTIAAGTNHSSIFSGNGNTVAGSCSSILGGSGNSDGGFPFTGMYGNALIASVAPATLGVPSVMWVDELVVANIVFDPTGALYPSLPAGALYTNVAPGTGYLQSQVYVA